MKVLYLNSDFTFDLVPREYLNYDDLVVLELRKEMTNEVYTPDFTFVNGQKMTVKILETDFFKVGDKYEIEINTPDRLIYLGKLLVVNENTDLQNFEYEKQNGRFGF